MSRTRAFFVIFAAASSAACNDGTAPEPVRLDDVLAEVAAVETYAAAGTVLGGAPTLPAYGVSAATCTFTAASESFVCPPVTHGGITIARSFQLLDASNDPLSAFDAATVAAVRTSVAMSGTTGGAGTTVAIESHSEQTVGGLLGNTRTVNGASTMRSIRTTSLGTDTLTADMTTDLTLPRPASAAQRVYPTGTVAAVMSGSSLLGGTMSMTTTFNGTSTATLTMSFGDTTHTCTIDLVEPSQGTCFDVGLTTR